MLLHYEYDQIECLDFSVLLIFVIDKNIYFYNY